MNMKRPKSLVKNKYIDCLFVCTYKRLTAEQSGPNFVLDLE